MHQHWGTLEKRTPLYKNYSGQIQRRNPQAKIKRGRNLHGRCQRICHGRASHSPALSPPTPCTQKHRPERERMRGRWLIWIKGGHGVACTQLFSRPTAECDVVLSRQSSSTQLLHPQPLSTSHGATSEGGTREWSCGRGASERWICRDYICSVHRPCTHTQQPPISMNKFM